MILVIRIAGKVDVQDKKNQALYRLRLRKKYSAVLLHPTPENLKLLKRIRNFVSYGQINRDTLKKLIEKRAKPLNAKEKINAEQIISLLDKKSLKDLGIKPFFSLHPPIGGIDSKKHAGVAKGVLGENKKINELIRRML